MHTVLLADDDPELRLLARLVLQRTKRFRIVAEAADGHEAISLARQHQPDLILLDLKMPRCSGFEALPELRRHSPHSKVVALSMLEREPNARQALERGATTFIDKGVSNEELVQRLLSLMEEADGGRPSAPPPPGRLLRWDGSPWAGFLLGSRSGGLWT